MSHSEQERFETRKWLDLIDMAADVVGVHVRVGNRSRLAQPDGTTMTAHVVEFLQRAGISAQAAQPVGVGATTGGALPGDTFQFMKPIGLTIQVVNFA